MWRRRLQVKEPLDGEPDGDGDLQYLPKRRVAVGLRDAQQPSIRDAGQVCERGVRKAARGQGVAQGISDAFGGSHWDLPSGAEYVPGIRRVKEIHSGVAR